MKKFIYAFRPAAVIPSIRIEGVKEEEVTEIKRVYAGQLDDFHLYHRDNWYVMYFKDYAYDEVRLK
jgi:hypothetical protein